MIYFDEKEQQTIQIVQETSKWWIPIVVAVITVIGAIIAKRWK